MDKLTIKQQAFADYFIECGNGTEAAIKAGYSKKTAKQIANENLTKPYLKAYIDTRLKEMESKRIASGEEVLQYLTKVMRGEEKDQFDLDAALQDRTKAAELLGKRYGLFKDKIDATITDTSKSEVTELLEQRRKRQTE